MGKKCDYEKSFPRPVVSRSVAAFHQKVSVLSFLGSVVVAVTVLERGIGSTAFQTGAPPITTYLKGFTAGSICTGLNFFCFLCNFMF